MQPKLALIQAKQYTTKLTTSRSKYLLYRQKQLKVYENSANLCSTNQKHSNQPNNPKFNQQLRFNRIEATQIHSSIASELTKTDTDAI